MNKVNYELTNMRLLILSFIFIACFVRTSHAEIIIRPANLDDLESVLELDREISWEYFKPLFLVDNDPSISENADALLEEDLIHDQIMFLEGAKEINQQRLYIALDSQGKIIGFIVFHLREKTVIIDLLLIQKDYRNQKIGKKLLESTFSVFDSIDHCELLAIINNVLALKCYEAMGFKRLREIPKYFLNDYVLLKPNNYVCLRKTI